jgi:DNA-3-methyladenine glycosylase II
MTTSSPVAPAQQDLPAQVDLQLRRTKVPAGGYSFLPDHLGWWQVSSHAGQWCRLAAGDARGPRILTSPGLRAATPAPELDRLSLPAAAANVIPRGLYRRLAARTSLARLRTPTVWEAAATATIRQVVRREQARVSFDRVCEALGACALLDGHARHAFPTAEMVIDAGESRLRATGVGFKARTLISLAEWSLDPHEHLDRHGLHEALLRVRGIGPWSASVAVCDVFSDYGFYPVEDLAIRSHAHARWPRRWPASPQAFAREWRARTAPHTAPITAFLIGDAVLSAPAATVQ